MTRKMSDAEAKRSPLNLRTTAELRRKLDEAASHNDRSITQEVERRLEQSFEGGTSVAPNGLKPDVVNFLNEHPEAGKFFNALGDVFMHIIKIMRDDNRNELDVRIALSAAANFLTHHHLWDGQTKIAIPAAAPGVRKRDQPPAVFGHDLAEDRSLWLENWSEPSVMTDTLDERVSDAWVGSGQVTVIGPTPEEAAERRRVSDEEALRSLDPTFSHVGDQANMKLYKPIR